MAEAFFEYISNGTGVYDLTDPVMIISRYWDGGSTFFSNLKEFCTSKLYNMNGQYPRSIYGRNLEVIDLPNLREYRYSVFNNLRSQVLRSVNFPNLLIYACDGNDTFSFCTSLETVNMPKVKFLQTYAFWDCPSLKEIVMDEALFIGSKAFDNCNNLEKISLDKVECVQGSAFGDIKAKELKLPNLKYIATSKPEDFLVLGYGTGFDVVEFNKLENIKPNAMLFTMSSTSISNRWLGPLCYNQGGMARKVYCPELRAAFSIESFISFGFFSSVDHTPDIQIPKLEKLVNCEQFFGRANIKTIYLPHLKRIDSCYRLFNNEYTYFDSINCPELECIIGSSVFLACYNYSKSALCKLVNLPKLRYIDSYGDQTYPSSKNSLFPYVTMSRLELPELKYAKTCFIGTYNYTLEYVAVPKLRSLYYYAFWSCAGLKSIDMHDCTCIYSDAFHGCQILQNTFELTSSLSTSPIFYLRYCSSIGNRGFRMCSGLTKMKMPKLEYVGPEAFDGCYNLRYVDFSKLKYIGSFAFRSASKLANVALNEVEYVDQGAFINCSLLGYKWCPCINGIPNSQDYKIRSIVMAAYSYPYIEHTEYGDYPRISFNYVSAHFSDDNIWYEESTGMSISYQVSDWLDQGEGTFNTLLLSKCISFMNPFYWSGSFIFSNWIQPVNMTKLYLPECQTLSLSGYALSIRSSVKFYTLTRLSEITIPKASKVIITDIPNLKTIYANGVSSLYSSTNYFSKDFLCTDCSNVEVIHLNGVKTIENDYYYYTPLRDFIPSTIKEIYMSQVSFIRNIYRCFESWPNLEVIYMPALLSISNYYMSFARNCSKLRKVNLDSLQSVRGGWFHGCVNLSILSLPGISVIDNAYANSSSNTIFPSNLKTLFLMGSTVVRMTYHYNWSKSSYALPGIHSVFGSRNPDVQIMVPNSLYDSYCECEEWKALNEWTDAHIIAGRI